MYAALPDPYCYPGTTILKNRLGLRDQDALDAYELAASTIRARQPLPTGRFGVAHYCAVHRHLFQDVYAWAGRIRTIRISKQTSTFCYPEHIRPSLTQRFESLRHAGFLRGASASEFVAGSTRFMAELNAIHPFREGNGRAQLSFLSMLASHAGHPLDMERLDPPGMLAAMVESFGGSVEPLATNIAALLPRG